MRAIQIRIPDPGLRTLITLGDIPGLTTTSIPDVPGDAKLLNVFHDDNRRVTVLTFEHGSFDECLDGVEFPRRNVWFHTYELDIIGLWLKYGDT